MQDYKIGQYCLSVPVRHADYGRASLAGKAVDAPEQAAPPVISDGWVATGPPELTKYELRDGMPCRVPC